MSVGWERDWEWDVGIKVVNCQYQKRERLYNVNSRKQKIVVNLDSP